VKAQELAVADSERYGHAANVEYIQALAYPENTMPVYPGDILARRLPSTAVTVRLNVDANGTVTGVEPLDATKTSGQIGLFAAVREACLRWKFSPLIRLDLDAGPTTVVEGEGTTTYKGRPTALPFHLDYVFNFSQHDGRPRVEAIDRK
jgi:outer membrane biosynthesis protein TonB